MTQKRDEAEMRHTPPKLRELRLQFDDGEEIRNNRIPLNKPNGINFTILFEEEPQAQRFEMTVTILKTDKRHTGSAGEFKLSPTAAAVTDVVTLQQNPPRVTLLVGHFHDDSGRILPPWHGGPGPYDAAVVLTPVSEDVHGESVAAQYSFTSV